MKIFKRKNNDVVDTGEGNVRIVAFEVDPNWLETEVIIMNPRFSQNGKWLVSDSSNNPAEPKIYWPFEELNRFVPEEERDINLLHEKRFNVYYSKKDGWLKVERIIFLM